MSEQREKQCDEDNFGGDHGAVSMGTRVGFDKRQPPQYIRFSEYMEAA
jgi:hypothetical protein